MPGTWQSQSPPRLGTPSDPTNGVHVEIGVRVRVGRWTPICTTYTQVLYNTLIVKISVSKARERLSEVVEMSQSEPVVLELYGKRAAVMVSPDQYDEMLEALEESHDVLAFDAALAEVGDNIPWEQVKSDLGWS